MSRGKKAKVDIYEHLRNIEAEASVLGAVLVDNNLFWEVDLDPSDFWDERHRHIWQAIVELLDREELVDTPSLALYLKEKGKIEEVGGVSYISSLLDAGMVTGKKGAVFCANRVKELARKRQILAGLEEVKSNFQEKSVSEIVAYLHQKMLAIRFEEEETLLTLPEVAGEFCASLDKEEVKGIKTFESLDNLTLGFRPGELIVVGARPGMGKTAFALSIAIMNAQKGIKSLFFSLEMFQEQLMQRMASYLTDIPLTRIRSQTLSPTEKDVIKQSLSNLEGIYISPRPDLTISQIDFLAHKAQKAYDIELVIVDYLQLIKPLRYSLSREEHVSMCSRGLKMIARKLNVPVVCLAQLNRECEKREDKRPILADLRYSGSIEQDADIVIFLYREDYYRPEKSTGECEVIVAKNRNGRTGSCFLRFESKFVRFVDIDGDLPTFDTAEF